MAYLNVEVKAKCSNPEAIKALLKVRGARYIGTDHQVDTYFKASRGRLKLREGEVENALVYYEREDKKGPKKSEVMLLKIDRKSSALLKEILSKVLGVLTVVEKRREIFFIGNVKFHIDHIEGLGAFIEIEAIDVDGSIGEEKLLEQCKFFMELFNISLKDLISTSYSDLLQRNSS